ncbi:MAG TPA: signal peptidase I [Acidobacteriaceae bacterium]
MPDLTASSTAESVEPKSGDRVPSKSRAEAPKPADTHEDAETALESLSSICTVLAVGLFVMTFIFQNFEIPSASMEKTLLIGDHVLVDRISLAPPSHWFPLAHYREPQHGDIIVFLKPHPETPDLYLVKRLIGMPGDRIHLEHGIVYLNGVAQNQPYAQMPDDGDPKDAYVPYRDDFPSDLQGIEEAASENNAATWAVDLPSHVQNGDLVVPPGHYFMMGDNRTQSLDGRFWGFVPRENIVGRPLFIYWSFETPEDQMYKTSIGERISFIGHILLHIFDETRWSRTFRVVR